MEDLTREEIHRVVTHSHYKMNFLFEFSLALANRLTKVGSKMSSLSFKGKMKELEISKKMGSNLYFSSNAADLSLGLM